MNESKMNKGAVLFAHNNGFVDYLRLAYICATRLKQILKIPVSLISDDETLSTSDVDTKIFDRVIVTDVNKKNTRVLDSQHQPFINQSRSLAYDLTPYENTLILDTDYLIYTDRLNQYWNLNDSFLMGAGVLNSNAMISSKAMKMKWATTIMFKKDKIAELIFNQVKHIEENYSFYADLYGFHADNYRNDYAFTIAEHIVNGLNSKTASLPNILFLDHTSKILSVEKDSVKALVKDAVVDIKGIDIHFFDKSVILDHEEAFVL